MEANLMNDLCGTRVPHGNYLVIFIAQHVLLKIRLLFIPKADSRRSLIKVL